MVKKSATAYRTISEVAQHLDLPQHVLRFWETKFTQIRPLKRGGRRRYYRPEDVALLEEIRHLLYDEGYTIKGVQKLLKERRQSDRVAERSADHKDDRQTASAPPDRIGVNPDLFAGSDPGSASLEAKQGRPALQQDLQGSAERVPADQDQETPVLSPQNMQESTGSPVSPRLSPVILQQLLEILSELKEARNLLDQGQASAQS